MNACDQDPKLRLNQDRKYSDRGWASALATLWEDDGYLTSLRARRLAETNSQHTNNDFLAAQSRASELEGSIPAKGGLPLVNQPKIIPRSERPNGERQANYPRPTEPTGSDQSGPTGICVSGPPLAAR